jgi:autotransporter family porin
VKTFTGTSPISIVNKGKVTASAVGIAAATYGAGSETVISNSGNVYGGFAAILAASDAGTTIVNSGTISAGTGFAIGVYGGPVTIYNSGTITGFVRLDADDVFVNQPGGTFRAHGISDFDSFPPGGTDLFVNEKGATVQAASDSTVKETTLFLGLDRFENKGLISLRDGAVGDVFEISNCGCSPLQFVASGKSELAVDAFLAAGNNSSSDIFIVDGDVSGKTKVSVHDVNPGPSVLNQTPIPVIYANGATPTGKEFYLAKPVDAGFFDYDLYFKPTGSGVWYLQGFLGQGAFVLPELITAAQDMWHSGSSTWFDRTADLRVLLNGGAVPAEKPNADDTEGTPPRTITPAVWARGAGGFLNRDDSEGVTANGTDYRFNLNRSLETVDFQSGIDLGKRGLFADNDILVFGALGGFVHSDLDYDAFTRLFSFEGGQVGGYATYLRGGLFVDTLVNVHLLQVDTRTQGFPNSLDATTVGVRTDSGYRFGSFRGGAFIEPLATISATWADINGFSLGGNTVSFNDDPAVQGRLGVRVGTSTKLWPGITMEPFVIGSLWGNLSNDNQATLVSTGTTFHLEDKLESVWGEVSGGVNVFNPSANTSLFAKVDVAFGQDIDGVGGKAGMRISW